ncbi:MAG: hypothetical protein HYV03_01530 [Deltaproteobacteria bacterium]|nr:hypothetical protein [Deltaproteobacteria bacterium]
MKFARDVDVTRWLEALAISEETLQWDGGNLPKLSKHRVVREEVQALFLSSFVLGGRIVEPFHPESRWVLFGGDSNGKATCTDIYHS